MKSYSNKITLFKNNRGVWDLDPFKGCEHAINGGCYGICYASRISISRGYDFSKIVKRDFVSKEHFKQVSEGLRGIPFVRMGVMCDPSYDWEHTLNIIQKIKPFNKDIVIITKHWNELKDEQLFKLKGTVVNTSISALDMEEHRNKMLFWYRKLKQHCRSVLRVNTADFNNLKLDNIQNELLLNENVIDNILRFPLNHNLVEQGIIKVAKHKFLDTYVYASRHDNNVFFGFCCDCKDQCGIIRQQKKIIDFI